VVGLENGVQSTYCRHVEQFFEVASHDVFYFDDVPVVDVDDDELCSGHYVAGPPPDFGVVVVGLSGRPLWSCLGSVPFPMLTFSIKGTIRCLYCQRTAGSSPTTTPSWSGGMLVMRSIRLSIVLSSVWINVVIEIGKEA